MSRPRHNRARRRPVPCRPLVVALERREMMAVDLTPYFNRPGIVADGSTFSGGLDGGGSALSSGRLGTSVASGGHVFTLGLAGANNAVAAAGQMISLPAGEDADLSLLGVGTFGSQANQPFVVTYADGSARTFTQSLSDWWVPQGFAGESVAATVPYIDTGAGGRLNHAVDVYRYDLALDPTKVVASVTLPKDSHVVVLAIALDAPSVRVAVGAATVASGGADAFGSAPIGLPLTHTYTVTNSGTSPLTLADPIALPAGFALAADFGSKVLAPGASTTFAVTLPATAPGSYSGTIGFATSAPGNPAFAFTATGSVYAQPPIAAGDSYATLRGQALVVASPAGGVLANDVDPQGRALTATLVTNGQNGSVSLNPDGTFTYAPHPGFVGQDTFTYTAGDGLLQGNAATVAVIVAASPFTAGPGASLAATEGQAFSGTVATFVDIAHQPVGGYNAVVDWGDGRKTVGTITRDGATYSVGASHAYFAAGTYPVSVELIAGPNDAATVRDTAAVATAPLAATPVTWLVRPNGSSQATLAEFTGRPGATAAQFTASVSWSGGKPVPATVVSLGGGAFGVAATYTFGASGPQPYQVTIGDNAGRQTTVAGSVQVDAAGYTPPGVPGGTGVAATATEGGAFSGVVGSFLDPNADLSLTDPASYTATIAWGDGTSTPGTVDLYAEGGLDVEGAHTYAQAGTYVVTATVQGQDGLNASASGTIRVNRAGWSVFADPFPKFADTSTSGPTAVLVVLDPNASSAQFQATVNWGDGTTSPASLTPHALADGESFDDAGYAEFDLGGGGHSYTRSGGYTVTVSVTDQDGTVRTASGSLTVSVPSNPAGPVGTPTVPDHNYAYLPGTIDMSESGPCVTGDFNACTLQYGPTPAVFSQLNLGPYCYLSTQTFPDPTTGRLYYYSLGYGGNLLFRLSRVYLPSPPNGPYHDQTIFTWLLGLPGNTWTTTRAPNVPFSMMTGQIYPGGNPNCQVMLKGEGGGGPVYGLLPYDTPDPIPTPSLSADAVSSTALIGVSADSPSTGLSVYASQGIDQDGNPIDAPDGTVIEWRVAGPNGATLAMAQTATTNGVATNTLTTTTKAGDLFKVYARIVKIMRNGNLVAWDSPDVELPPVAVVPGVASSLTLTSADATLPADGTSQTKVTLVAKDAKGNPVADGTAVDWAIAGGGTILTGSTSATDGGQVVVTVQSAVGPGAMTVTATVGGVAASVQIQALPIRITLGITGNVLTLGSLNSATVTAIVQDTSGRNVAANTPISWVLPKGGFTYKDTLVQGGRATLIINGVGGSQMPGYGFVRAAVGTGTASRSYLWVLPPGQYGVQVDHLVLAGDQNNDGSIAVDQDPNQPGGSPTKSYSYYANAEVQVSGTPNATVRIQAGTPGTASAGALQVIGDNGGSTVKLDQNGRGTFRLRSTGSVPSSKQVLVPVTLYEQGKSGETLRSSFNVLLLPARYIAATLNYVANLGWGVITGDGETPDAIAADIAFSLTPGIGIYTDIRDAAKEIFKLWPGGESFKWPTFLFAVLGMATSLGGPGADTFPTLLKTIVKNLDNASPLFRVFTETIKNFQQVSLGKLVPLMGKLAVDVPFLKLAERTLVDARDGAAGLMKLVKVTSGIGLDRAADFLKRVAAFGDDAAKSLFQKLASKSADDLAQIGTTLDQLGQAGKLDVLAKGVGGGTWNAGNNVDQVITKYGNLVSDASAGNNVKYLDQLDEYAAIPGSQNWVTNGFTGGVKLEMDTAQEMAGRGQKVVEVNKTIPNPAKPGENLTDIDIVTSGPGGGYAVSSKGLDFSGLTGKNLNDALTAFKKEMEHYADFAKTTGRTPALKIPAGQPLPKAFEDAILEVEKGAGVLFERL